MATPGTSTAPIPGRFGQGASSPAFDLPRSRNPTSSHWLPLGSSREATVTNCVPLCRAVAVSSGPRPQLNKLPGERKARSAALLETEEYEGWRPGASEPLSPAALFALTFVYTGPNQTAGEREETRAERASSWLLAPTFSG